MTVTTSPTIELPAGDTEFGGRIKDGKLDPEVIRRDFPVLGTEVHGTAARGSEIGEIADHPRALRQPVELMEAHGDPIRDREPGALGIAVVGAIGGTVR